MTPAATSPRAAGAPPGRDERFAMIEASMKRHRHRPDALIEVLHTAQGLFGYLDRDILYHVARGLHLPPSRVYGVASFYHLFRFEPKGAHHCTVCLGTACFVKGAGRLLSTIEQVPGLRAGGAVSLDTARCVGACGIAPVVIFDGEVAGNQTPETVAERVKGWRPRGPA